MMLIAEAARRPHSGEEHHESQPIGFAHSFHAGSALAISSGSLLLIPVLTLAIILRSQQFSTVGVHLDESFAQRLVEFQWEEFFDRLRLDTHPPLYYVVLKLWTLIFGASVFAGRSLSALFGISAVVGMYAFVSAAYRREDRSPRVNFFEADLPAVVAAFVLTVAPMHLFWSQNIRMYSMATALALWSSYFLIRALRRRPGRTAAWIAYTMAAVALAYTHYFGLFVLASHYVYALGYRLVCGDGSLFKRIAPALLSASFVTLAFLPWLPFLLDQQSQVAQNFHLPKPSWDALGNTMHELWYGSFGAARDRTIGLVISQLLVMMLLILAMGRRPPDYLILISVAVPVISVIAVSNVSRSIISPRYFQISQVFLMAAVAVVVCRVPRFGKYAAIALLAFLLYFPWQAYHSWRAQAALCPGLRAVTAKLDAVRRDEPVVVCSPMIYPSVSTYIQDSKGIYLFRPAAGIPFYLGTAAVRSENYADIERVRDINSDYLWVLSEGEMARWGMSIPTAWALVEEERYQEWFGPLILRLYSRVEPHSFQ